MMALAGPILTAAEMQAAEAAVMAIGETVESLMERAGAAVAEAVWRYGGGRPVLVLCGPGNNGGDGYVAARMLADRRIDVRVAAFGEPRTAAALTASKAWTGPVAALADAAPAPVLVDALFGTGLSRPLGQEVAGSLAKLAAAARFVIAVDVPSGVGTDDGADLGTVAANLTLALGALKPAHMLQPSAQTCGIVRVADIGVPVASALGVIARPHFSEPGADSHKYRRGMVAILAGEMPGASVLAASAAMRLAGYVVAADAGDVDLPAPVVRRDWGAVAEDRRVGALLVGPGLGRSAGARAAVDRALATAHPLVLDADALMLLSPADFGALKARSAPVIMTPHSGEFDALFGAGTGSRVERARAAAHASGAVIVLKGADTVVARADGEARIGAPAPGWLASAGTGDVLAGLVAACVAGGRDPMDAGCSAVWLHGEAARRAGPAFAADDLARFVPAAIAACLR